MKVRFTTYVQPPRGRSPAELVDIQELSPAIAGPLLVKDGAGAIELCIGDVRLCGPRDRCMASCAWNLFLNAALLSLDLETYEEKLGEDGVRLRVYPTVPGDLAFFRSRTTSRGTRVTASADCSLTEYLAAVELGLQPVIRSLGVLGKRLRERLTRVKRFQATSPIRGVRRDKGRPAAT